MIGQMRARATTSATTFQLVFSRGRSYPQYGHTSAFASISNAQDGHSRVFTATTRNADRGDYGEIQIRDESSRNNCSFSSRVNSSSSSGCCRSGCAPGARGGSARCRRIYVAPTAAEASAIARRSRFMAAWYGNSVMKGRVLQVPFQRQTGHARPPHRSSNAGST